MIFPCYNLIDVFFFILSVLGHEACVEVVEHKRDNIDLNIGDRITFSIADSCGNCDFCLNGLSQKCKSLFKVILKNMIVHLHFFY
jgi:threonine dehydrogenase-like Zn-dependent dehydrogenase